MRRGGDTIDGKEVVDVRFLMPFGCPFWLCFWSKNRWGPIPGLSGVLFIYQGNPSISPTRTPIAIPVVSNLSAFAHDCKDRLCPKSMALVFFLLFFQANVAS